MADYVVLGLVKRPAELTGESETLRTRLAPISTDLGHLDAAIRQFDPEHDVASIRPKRPRREDAARPGEMSRDILGVLREVKEPLPTVEVARRFMADRGIDADDPSAVRLATKRIGMTLSHQKVKATMRAVSGAGKVGACEVAR